MKEKLEDNFVCQFAVYNISKPDESLSSLSSSVLNSGVTEEEAINHSKCSEDSGFRFDGSCINKIYLETNAENSPDETKKGIEFLYSFLYGLAFPINFCLGDFTGNFIKNDFDLQNNKCHTIPLMGNFNYGLLGGKIDGIPTCGVNPVNVEFCTTFDRCGTVGIAMNSALIQCAATYSTGIAAILSPVASVLNHVALGFSLKRRFVSAEFDVLYLDGGDVSTKKVTTYGHFFLQVGFKFSFR